ncbi:transcriptional regulator with XRE-family HTH domain [Herbihabitans rhizosphaerae]|uniref:Transcriptional regulator with XRE-family HTH domain n=2 Tax=Herbihabitans rhizosphaerae TaxID=1872711 RepID=A0A4Q7KVX2_9PSEU|nr:transcriptional regulator with XRE-family HTH domain [Herbihabitans rhizosphaerae]
MARTPKARALGAALRQARQANGMILRELGAAIGRDIGVISRWENGERTPKPEQVAQILTKLGVTGERYDEIMTLAYRTGESQWVATTLPERRQQMVAYVDWEQNARQIVEVAPLLIPGLLQVPDYVRGIMTDAGVSASEIASRVTERIGRRDVITKRNPASLLVLLGHATLRQDIGGRDVTIEQLQHLLTMATCDNIELRLIPDHRGWHPGLDGTFALIEAKRPTDSGRTRSSVVFAGTRLADLMLHEDTDVAAYRRAIDKIMAIALPPESSARIIADLLDRMEKDRGT